MFIVLESIYTRSSESTRAAAVMALTKLGHKGDRRIVSEVCTRLEHPVEDVRKAALMALPQVVPGKPSKYIPCLPVCLAKVVHTCLLFDGF